MDELNKRLALISITGALSMLAVIDMLTIALLSDKPETVKWANNGLRTYGEMRKKQTGEETYKITHDLILEFLKYIDEPQKIEKIVVGFGMN